MDVETNAMPADVGLGLLYVETNLLLISKDLAAILFVVAVAVVFVSVSESSVLLLHAMVDPLLVIEVVDSSPEKYALFCVDTIPPLTRKYSIGAILFPPVQREIDP